MIRDYDFDNDDYPTAVAAAAFAVHSLDRSKSRDKNVQNYGHGKSLNKMRSKAEKSISAINFSDKHVKDDDRKSPESPLPRPNSPPVANPTAQPAKPDKSREKAVQSHRHEIRRIEEIAAEARAHAEVKRVKEELKVKEKANKIRLTGKLPATCLCF
ncbi:hypothetical protein PHJA_000874000 [Phtheirospermum japonicum]|uniref:Remorin C-terminal domain-containing protein n=1 Tax=Phtheirospermum japonicum TaxID=374723 RepID=A0A830BTI2_9LAMI|nr:hypothetical protein PHJA_000874000 [Phtheirospermum japonicum]